MTTSAPEPAADAWGVSLVRDDPFFRLQRRVGLIPAHGLGLVRRAVFWSLVSWVPMAVWAVLTGRAGPRFVPEPLLAHFGIHVRALVAVPLFVLAEGTTHAMSMRVVPYFVRSGLIADAVLPRFRETLAGIVRLRNATVPWVTIVAVVVALSSVSELLEHAHEIDWAMEGAGPMPRFGFGALWFLYVVRPIYLAFLFGWVWRLMLQFLLFQRIAALDLAIVPTHPDRTGGLAFLERVSMGVAPVVFAIASVLASGWAHDVVYHGVSVQALRVQMVVFVAVAVLLFLSPLLAFAGPLRRCQRQALLDYGALVGRHGRLVHTRWIEGREVAEVPLLDAPELGPVADVATVYDAVREMRTLPVGKTALAPLVLAAALPMIGVLAIEVPVKDLLLGLLKALL